MPRRPPGPRGAGLLALSALCGLAACASAPVADPRYRPAESVLEVVTVLRRHVPDDTYRFVAARDFTGRNVYRSSLLRLESLQRIHADALRAGHLDGVIAFSKGRALERLRAFDLAAGEYRMAAERETALEEESLRSAELCDRLEKSTHIGAHLDPLAAETADLPLASVDPEAAVQEFEKRSALLDALLAEVDGTHYTAVVREELERVDVARAQYFQAMRRLVPKGNLRAVSELQRVVTRHRESKNASRHLLSLAEFYGDLAVEYVEAHPPEGLSFDPTRFQELIDSAARLFEMVAKRDGTPERLEASRRLEAFLAFALRVDRDRFTP